MYKHILIVGCTAIDSDAVSPIIKNIIEQADNEQSFVCIGYSEKSFVKRINDNLVSIGIKDPFLGNNAISYRILRRLYLWLNKDNFLLSTRYAFKKIKTLIKDEQFDLIIGCSGRFCFSEVGYKLAKERLIPLRLAFFDSCVYNPYVRNRAKRLKKQNEWISYAQKLLINIEAQSRLQDSDLSKTEFFKIPIRNRQVSFDRDSKNYIYGGTFYKNIREPDDIIKFADSLENDKDIVICYSNIPQEKSNNKIKFRKILPYAEFIDVCQSAKALIYIGNKGTDVVSSKFLEYLSLKKPIIGINVSEKDDVRKYPFYFDSDDDLLCEKIDSITINDLCGYDCYSDYPDRNPVYLYRLLSE